MIVQRSFVISALVGFAIICASSATGEVQTSAAPAAQPPPVAGTTTVASAATTTPVADPVVCKHLEAPTGSRLGASRTCLKKSEWDEMNRRARATIDGIQHGGAMGNCTASMGGGPC